MTSKINLYRFGRRLGKSHLENLMAWSPTLGKYFLIGGLGTIWMTDWKFVGRYIPFWGGRFKEPEQ